MRVRKSKFVLLSNKTMKYLAWATLVVLVLEVKTNFD